MFAQTEAVRIVACGTSFHAASVAKYFIEQICRLPCWVEIASEYRYRNPVVPKNTLFVTSRSPARPPTRWRRCAWPSRRGTCRTLAICNVPESSLVRESELVMLTRAGPEIGVASTKAFTTQLAALTHAGDRAGQVHSADAERERGLVQRLLEHPGADREDAGARPGDQGPGASASPTSSTRCSSAAAPMYPIAMEGALKLKEISYIHAEAYPAGELKHGPLALVDADMPVITVAPNNDLLEKLKSNLMEVRARGGELYVFADPESGIEVVATACT